VVGFIPGTRTVLTVTKGNVKAPQNTSGWEGPLRFWDTDTGQAWTRGDADLGLNLIAVSPDGRFVALRSLETLQLIDIETWTPRWTRRLPPWAGKELGQFSPDGRTFVFDGITNESAYQVLDVATGNDRCGLPSTTYMATCFAPENRLAVAGEEFLPNGRSQSVIRVHDLGSNQIYRTFLVPDNRAVWSIGFSPDGRHLVAAADEVGCVCWDVESGRELFRRSEEDVTFPTGVPWFAVTQVDEVSGFLSIVLVGYADGQEYGRMDIPHWSPRVREHWVSPNGRLVVSSEWRSNELDLFLWKHGISLPFLPLSTNDLRLWDVSRGQPLGTLTRKSHDEGQWWDVQFSPDGRLLAVVASGRLEVWDLPPGAPWRLFSGVSATWAAVVVCLVRRRLCWLRQAR
jgi:WD40 repeat protein